LVYRLKIRAKVAVSAFLS